MYKQCKFILLILIVSCINACIPIPPTSPSPTPVDTATGIPTGTFTSIPSATSTITPSVTATGTETPSPTSSATGTATFTSTPTSTFVTTVTPNPVNIPSLNDWDSGSLALSHGAEGEWDAILWGGFANSLIKKGNTYYLYYQGSSSYDDQCESVAHRAIGVATSTDGINWVKSPKNPVITWTSQGSIEEGATSSAAWLGQDGKIYLYYGANTGSGCNVNTNARLAVSEDGETFQDAGEVLSGKDPNVWGSGDEIFPIGISSHENKWYLYYTPNGVPLARKLGVAIGNSPATFTQSMGLNDSTLPAWGPVSVILNEDHSVLVTNPNDGSGNIHFYQFDANNPSVVQAVTSYAVPNCNQASVLYEAGTHHWMMSCRDQNAENYYIRNAYTP